MPFTSLEFPLFFLAVMLLRRIARNSSAEIWVLLVASYAFFASASLLAVLLILSLSAVDYQVGKLLGATDDPTRRKRWLFVSLSCNLGTLAYFKYANFIVHNLNAALVALGVPLQLPYYDVFLPPGISYFTFTSMSYVIDVYYERLAPTRAVSDYLLYVSYFPKALAGPIVRAGDLLSQLRDRVRANAEDIEIGFAYFMLGAVKKVVIADQLRGHVDLIFSNPTHYDALTLLQGAVGYSIQIYCDFSGYSDMAIGCARILGVRFPENFAMPYSATSLTEFWRRWHMTLSSWFRDYVFLPLEMATRGNRNGTLRASVNLMITMTLCGLWHGASWNFVFWGGLHGAALAIERAWKVWWSPGLEFESPALRFVWSCISRFLTLGVVVVGWVFFRAESWDDAIAFVTRLLTWNGIGLRVMSPYIWGYLVVVLVAHLCWDKDRNWAEEMSRGAAPVRIAAYSALLVLLTVLGTVYPAPFVYLQF
jgi:alginate O-acetyltransferase complex protein AlgI